MCRCACSVLAPGEQLREEEQSLLDRICEVGLSLQRSKNLRPRSFLLRGRRPLLMQRGVLPSLPALLAAPACLVRVPRRSCNPAGTAHRPP
jgi:hypothetical protein